MIELHQVHETGREMTAEVLRASRAAFAPPPELTVSEFAEQEIHIPTGPMAGTRWSNDFAPYQAGIMDAFHEPGVQTVVGMCSSQVGKTSIGLNMVAYHVAHDPCPILIVQPTARPMAEEFSKNRLQPLIQATPILRRTVSKKRSRDSSNTVFEKSFRGGTISIGGANSAASLASRPVRFLLLDEIDRFPIELPGEGNTIAIARARTKAYGRRRRVAMFSSPTIVDAPIHAWWKEGDQRRFYVPCDGCGTMHPFKWEDVRFENRDPETARLHCPSCDHGMEDAERKAMLDEGDWVAENPDRRDKSIVSFHLSELYSPITPLAEIVEGFLKARAAQKAGDASLMHTWQNTTLGEPIELEGGEGVDSAPLLARRESYGECDVPAGACLLTMGVDTQDDRLEYLVVGWGPGEESWLVDRDILPGDPANSAVWEMLDEVLVHEYLHESGVRLPISATFIDSAGHRTDHVYDYGYRNQSRRFYVSIGKSGNYPIIRTPSMPRKRAQGGRKVPLYVVGVDAAKALFMSRLKLEEAGPGYVHIPNKPWADDELIAQFTSERLMTRWHKGRPKTEWKKTRARNEMLDCMVLSIAALRRLGTRADLEVLHQRLSGPQKSREHARKASVNPITRRPAGSYWRRNR